MYKTSIHNMIKFATVLYSIVIEGGCVLGA